MPTQPTSSPTTSSPTDPNFGYTAPATAGPAFAPSTPASTPAATPNTQAPQYTVQQMANAVRQKYPGAYDKVDDQKLVDAWTAKYPVYKAQIKQAPTYGSQIVDAAKAGIGKIGEGVNEANPTGPGGVGGLVTGVGKILGGAAETISSPITPAVSAVATPAINKYANFATSDKNPFLPAGAKGIEDFANSPAGKTTSDVAATVSDYANAAGTVAGVDGAVRAVPSVLDSVKNIKYSAETPVAPKTSTPLNVNKVTDLYNRAIRPTVTGKSTAAQVTKANTQAVSGLQAIADNKPNLEFTNADGEVTKGATPKTVDQLNQGIGQTKKTIFQQYDAAAQQAGEKGVTVNGPKIATELDPVVNSKSLALANPQAVDYAKTVQARYVQAGEITAQDAQDVIQHYNDSLKAFYRNPSYDTASKAGIDSLIANKMRGALDEGISGATGEQYQALKSQYGALSAMEKDVAHRAVVWARQNKVGLGANLSNMASGAELVRGLLTMNPTDIAVSGVIKGIQKYTQYLNNPDVQISKLFAEIEKSGRPSTGSMSAPGAPEPVVNSSPDGSTPTAGSTGADAPSGSIVDKAKSAFKAVKTDGQRGFAKIGPSSTPPKIPKDDLATMSDFTDYHAGSYKPGAVEGQKLELDASRIWEKYFPNRSMPKTNAGISNAFGKHLESVNFGKSGGADHDELGRFTSTKK